VYFLKLSVEYCVLWLFGTTETKVQPDPPTTNEKLPQPPQRFSPWQWLALGALAFFFVAIGVRTIVTHVAGAGIGMGSVTLDPVSAWITGLATIAVGLGFPALLLSGILKFKTPDQEAKPDPVRHIKIFDNIFLVTGTAVLAVWGLFGARLLPGRSSLLFVGTLFAVYALYKLVRMVLEYRAGVCVPVGGRWRRFASEHDRATQPKSFWWDMGMEMFYLVIGGGIAVLLLTLFAQGS
jgi:hypothetical protein